MHARDSGWCVLLGFSVESDSDAVGELDNGHASVAGAGDRAANRGDVAAQAVRPHKAAHLTDYDEEYHRSFCLSADRHSHYTLCRSLTLPCVKHVTNLVKCDCKFQFPDLFSPLGKPADRAIYFTFCKFFLFKFCKAISASTGPIVTIFFTKWKIFL